MPDQSTGPTDADPTSVTGLTDRAEQALGSVLRRGSRVALVNFPNHGNPGDPAIWLGTRALLRRLGVRVGYSAAWWSLDPIALRRAVPNGPVLINGGGNLGDLYAGQQGARVRVLTELTDRDVVQLPQSIYFRDPANSARMADLIAAHGRFTLMVREGLSVQRARDELGIESVLSPDHALGLGRLHPIGDPTTDLLWLTRRPGDPEYSDLAEPPERPGLRRVEWLEQIGEHQATWSRSAKATLAANQWAMHRWKPSATGGRHLWPAVAATFSPIARQWTDRGVQILSSARVVVTDKLHGHLLCLMLGKPHVVLDNSYGKVSGTLDTWTGGLPGVHRADDADQALAIADELLAEEAAG